MAESEGTGPLLESVVDTTFSSYSGLKDSDLGTATTVT